VVRLQVDVDAARARAEFEATSRTVDRLGDELDQAEDDARDLRFEFDRAAREAADLRTQVAATDQRLEDLRSTARAMGRMMPQNLREELQRTERASRDLHRQLTQQENATRDAARAMSQASARANLLADELDDAEEEAAELRRELDRLDAEAGRSLNRIRRSLLDTGSQFGRAGRDVGRSFVTGMGPAVLAGVAVLGPPIGAMLSSVILAAVGTGVAGAGAALAIQQSDALQRSFTRTFREMGDGFKRFATGFDDELFAVSERFGRMWDRIGDDFSNAFEKAQKFVEPLADGLAGLVEGMIGGGGFNAAMDAAGPVIGALSAGLSRLGDAFNSFFQSLADGGDGATKGMILLMDMLAGAVIVLGNTLEVLSKGFDFYTDAAEDYSAVMAGMLGWIPGVGDAWQKAAEKTGQFNDEANKTRSIVPIVGVEVDETGRALDRQAAAAQKAAREAQNLSNKLHQLLSDQLTAQQAAIAWEQAIDDISASFQENGRSIDISTQKGRENVQTVLAAVQAAEAKRQAAIDLAGGEKASADAIAAANAAFKAQIDQLGAILRQAGLTEDQISQLLSAYRNLAAAPDITKRITYRVSASGPAALVNAAQQSGSYSSGIGGRAKGGPIMAGMPYVVGEKGPELITPERDGYVHTAAQTARMLSTGPSGGGSGSPGRAATTATWTGSASGLEALFYRFLQGAIRTGKLNLA
jgi:hypothetical protein